MGLSRLARWFHSPIRRGRPGRRMSRGGGVLVLAKCLHCQQVQLLLRLPLSLPSVTPAWLTLSLLCCCRLSDGWVCGDSHRLWEPVVGVLHRLSLTLRFLCHLRQLHRGVGARCCCTHFSHGWFTCCACWWVTPTSTHLCLKKLLLLCLRQHGVVGLQGCRYSLQLHSHSNHL